MTSASGVRATADVPNNSEPESLDSLAYDDWEGQFEFVGSNNGTNDGTATLPPKTESSDVEDLNLTTPKYSNQSLRNCPILIDEETFLSMQSTDEPYSMIAEQPSNQLIENALKHLQFDNTVPSINKLPNRRSSQIDVNNSSSLSFDNIIEMKNRRNVQSDSNNNSCCHSDAFKMSDANFAHELYDSLLKEQVSESHTPFECRIESSGAQGFSTFWCFVLSLLMFFWISDVFNLPTHTIVLSVMRAPATNERIYFGFCAVIDAVDDSMLHLNWLKLFRFPLSLAPRSSCLAVYAS